VKNVPSLISSSSSYFLSSAAATAGSFLLLVFFIFLLLFFPSLSLLYNLTFDACRMVADEEVHSLDSSQLSTNSAHKIDFPFCFLFSAQPVRKKRK